jgi:hypothetical protein
VLLAAMIGHSANAAQALGVMASCFGSKCCSSEQKDTAFYESGMDWCSKHEADAFISHDISQT